MKTSTSLLGGTAMPIFSFREGICPDTEDLLQLSGLQ
jgi:hypothetical protein